MMISLKKRMTRAVHAMRGADMVCGAGCGAEATKLCAGCKAISYCMPPIISIGESNVAHDGSFCCRLEGVPNIRLEGQAQESLRENART